MADGRKERACTAAEAVPTCSDLGDGAPDPVMVLVARGTTGSSPPVCVSDPRFWPIHADDLKGDGR